MSRTHIWLLIMLSAPAMLLGPLGCETMQEHKRTTIGTATGAAVGGLAGGIIGHQSGHKGAGVAIGAATGALIGGGIGYALDRRAADRLRQIQGVDVQVNQEAKTDTGETVPQRMTLRVSNEVLFERGSAALSPEGSRKIAEIAAVIRDYPDTSVNVRGYASSEGGDEYNLQLSQRRASAVADTLVANKVDQRRLAQVTGLGESNPIGDNSTEAGRAMNRRVEIEVFPTADIK
ncbi:MAG: OmpA family protein [Candidatus Sumerlaeia bacterium]